MSPGPERIDLPQGFRASGVKAGIKPSGSDDFALIVVDGPCAAAGTYTTNRVAAAPVLWDRALTPSATIRAIVINAGNANAATGELGLANARRTAELVATRLECQPEQVLVASTGVIGRQLPMDRIAIGVERAFEALTSDAAGFIDASRSIMTTDTRPKRTTRMITTESGAEHRVFGMAKGAAMIGPRMATMLGFLLTDAPLDSATLQTILSEAVENSFNCISVEGHASTNDTVIALARSGSANFTDSDLSAFSQAIRSVCSELAAMIVDDGEGSTHRIIIDVEGAADREQARTLARAVADSPLVKTAIHGADPNWGRIVSAAGYAGIPFDQNQLSLWLNDVLVYENGTPTNFNAETLSQSIRNQRDVTMRLLFQLGSASIRFWTCDLTAEYVHLNADYTT